MQTLSPARPQLQLLLGANNLRRSAGEEGDVRLVGTVEVNGYVTGALQVFCDGQWGAVCNSNFNNSDALVACRQLGFSTGAATGDGGGLRQRRFATSNDPVRCLAFE